MMVESRQSTVLAVTIIFLVLSSVFVFLRFLSKTFVVRRVGPDDYWILAAWVEDGSRCSKSTGLISHS